MDVDPIFDLETHKNGEWENESLIRTIHPQFRARRHKSLRHNRKIRKDEPNFAFRVDTNNSIRANSITSNNDVVFGKSGGKALVIPQDNKLGQTENTDSICVLCLCRNTTICYVYFDAGSHPTNQLSNISMLNFIRHKIWKFVMWSGMESEKRLLVNYLSEIYIPLVKRK